MCVLAELSSDGYSRSETQCHSPYHVILQFIVAFGHFFAVFAMPYAVPEIYLPTSYVI